MIAKPLRGFDLSNIRFIGQFVEEIRHSFEEIKKELNQNHNGKRGRNFLRRRDREGDGRETERKENLFDCSYVVTYINNIG